MTLFQALLGNVGTCWVRIVIQAAAGLLPDHSIRSGFDVTRFSFRRFRSGSLALVSLFHT